MTNPRLLIDADGVLYKSVAASEYEGDWGDGIFVASTNIGKAKDMVQSQIEAYQRELGDGEIIMVLSGANNFRKQLDPTYKANRVGRKPLGYKAMEEWLKENYTCVVQDLLEADDYLGILATKPDAPDSIIVSDDKDLLTIPAKVFRLGILSTIDEDAAERYWFSQALTGDPADGYKGCTGVGAVGAEKILSKSGSRWENVKREFIKAGLTEEYAILQARLSRILHYKDWDSVAQKPILWTPPSV
jgi:DNA polymerase-1